MDNPAQRTDEATRKDQIAHKDEKNFDTVLKTLDNLELDLDPVIGRNKKETAEQAL